MLERGPAQLSDAELLAIFLRVGVKGKSAVDLARQLLSHFGSLRTLLTASQGTFAQSRAWVPPSMPSSRPPWRWAGRHLGESLERGKPLSDLATAVLIFDHNHQAGVAEPSDTDRRLTRRLADALGLADIRVLDHFVVRDGEVASFAEKGWI